MYTHYLKEMYNLETMGTHVRRAKELSTWSDFQRIQPHHGTLQCANIVERWKYQPFYHEGRQMLSLSHMPYYLRVAMEIDLCMTSAGCTTRMVSPVWNRPTSGHNRHVFSRGVTRPKVQTQPLFIAWLSCSERARLTGNNNKWEFNSMRLTGRVVMDFATHIYQNLLVNQSCIAPSLFVHHKSATQPIKMPDQLTYVFCW